MRQLQGIQRGVVRGAIFLILAALLPAAAFTAESAYEELVVEVRINEQDLQEMLVVLRDQQGGFWIEAADLERLRLRRPAAGSEQYQGQEFVPVSAYEGSVSFEEPTAMLFLQLPASAFVAKRISAPEGRPARLLDAATGTFANYQLFGQRIAGSTNAGALTELGLFNNRLGVVTSNVAARYDAGNFETVRLDTALTRDFPSRLETLTVGDSISDPGSWGSALRFGGIRYARNFAIRPELVTAPLLTASGSAVVPSTVDVFVNNERVLTDSVQPGPFVIDNLPTITGAGDLRVVVRDATGREQVLVQPFYSSPQLLARDLSQYSFSLGQVRRNFALQSFDYGDWVGSATLRRGLSDAVTLEGHAEFVEHDARGAGLQLSARTGRAGIANFTTAVGGDSSSSGWLLGAGFEHQRSRGSALLDVSWAGSGFRRAGVTDSTGARQKFRGVVQLGLNFGRGGSGTLAFAEQVFQDDSRQRTASAMYSLQANNLGYVNLAINRSIGSNTSTSAFLTFTKSWGRRRTISAGAEGGNGPGAARSELRSSVSQSLPAGEGSGWRLGATAHGSYDALWQQRLDALDIELQAARNNGQSGQRVQVSGGAAFLGGKARAVRSINGSFAVVDVAGIPDVPVYLENHLVTRTDANGRALLPNLLSYESNRISIEPGDLPLNTSVTGVSMTLRPAFRSGVVARFPVEHISPAVFNLRRPDGSAVPSGALVELNGGEFTVAMDGFTYVTTLDHGVGATATWEGGSCEFRVEPPPQGDPLPDMGEITCQ